MRLGLPLGLCQAVWLEDAFQVLSAIQLYHRKPQPGIAASNVRGSDVAGQLDVTRDCGAAAAGIGVLGKAPCCAPHSHPGTATAVQSAMEHAATTTFYCQPLRTNPLCSMLEQPAAGPQIFMAAQ